jgi:hypothetical protein
MACLTNKSTLPVPYLLNHTKSHAIPTTNCIVPRYRQERLNLPNPASVESVHDGVVHTVQEREDLSLVRFEDAEVGQVGGGEVVKCHVWDHWSADGDEEHHIDVFPDLDEVVGECEVLGEDLGWRGGMSRRSLGWSRRRGGGENGEDTVDPG